MITGAHAIVFAEDPEAARAFFDDTLGLRAVDAGGGWLIFALPPAELACHPTAPEDSGRHELFLMCDDIEATVAELEASRRRVRRAHLRRGLRPHDAHARARAAASSASISPPTPAR